MCLLSFLQLGTTTVGGKQTIVITKPGTGGPSGVRPQTSQIIVVTTASAVRGLQPAATTPITTPAGAQPAQVMTHSFAREGELQFQVIVLLPCLFLINR